MMEKCRLVQSINLARLIAKNDCSGLDLEKDDLANAPTGSAPDPKREPEATGYRGGEGKARRLPVLCDAALFGGCASHRRLEKSGEGVSQKFLGNG